MEQLGSGMSRNLRVYDKEIFHISEHFIKGIFPYAEPQNIPKPIYGDEIGS